MSDIKRQLAAARRMANLSQSELAQASGLSVAAFANIERGESDPRVSTWERIRDALYANGVEIRDNCVCFVQETG